MLDHFLDIYAMLVTGVISFIAPVTSYLLSTYLTDRNQILKRLEEQEKTINELLKKDLKEWDKQGLAARKIIENGNTQLKLYETQIKHKLYLLNFLDPKQRIGCLFSVLFLSIGSLMLDALVRGNVFNLYDHKLSIWLLIISCLSFIFAILSLWKIAWYLIDAKEIIVKEHKEIIESSTIEVVQQDIVEIRESEAGLPVA